MPLRTVDVVDANPTTRRQRLERIVFNDNGAISAHWIVTKRNGQSEQVVVEVSALIVANIVARAAVIKLLDDIKDDTFPRSGGQ